VGDDIFGKAEWGEEENDADRLCASMAAMRVRTSHDIDARRVSKDGGMLIGKWDAERSSGCW
jgi:hypothetical protein